MPQVSMYIISWTFLSRHAIANLLLDIVKVYIKLLRVLKPLEKYNKLVTEPCTNVLMYI